jgi:hypothetical protein
MTAQLLEEGVEVSVLEAEKVELTAFVRRMVSDSMLRERFQRDPAAALAEADPALSPATREAIIAQAPTIMSATADVDKAMHAAFFLIIIIRKGG